MRLSMQCTDGCKMWRQHMGFYGRNCKKPIFEKLIREKRFERYVILSNRYRLGGIEAVYDENGDLIYREA